MSPLRRAPVALAVLALGLGACSRPVGLGAKACPYVRPRLVRVDRDRLEATPADLVAVATDFDLYVAQLPGGGKGHSDAQLVRFSAALDALTRAPGPATTTSFDGAERALKQRCGVPA